MRGLLQLALAGAATAASFNWDDVKPNHDLEYSDCYDGFKCARLILPMDWNNETNDATVEIAITKLPAVVNDTDPTFAGPMFTNPGGPGGSGVQFVLKSGHMLRDIVDIPGKKHYDIFSFDPRGIGRSTPSINCYDSVFERTGSYLEVHGNGGLDSSLGSLQYGMALFAAESQRCANALGDFLSYVGTPYVARDMVAMLDKIHEARQKQLARSTKSEEAEDEESRLELRSTGDDESEEDVPRLQYIGFSYGTVLGNYFASLFPGRVGRMILDGVCNTDDYANGAGWLTNTVDADEVVENFFKGCFKAGTDCGMYKDSDKSGADIQKRFWSWMDELGENPQVGTAEGSTAVLRSTDFLGLLTISIYSPQAAFKTLARDFGMAMSGNLSSVLTNLMSGTEMPALKDGCLLPNVTEAPSLLMEARSAVVCVDGSDVHGHNTTWWKDYVDKQLEVSKVAGGVWTTIRLPCASWQYQTNWPFRGPFKTPPPSKSPSKPEAGKPAAPLLFVSNRLDPVTPLRAAREMSKGHPGSGVLVQESMGHTALAHGGVGACMRKVVAEYLDKGVVPDEEVACEAICDPWGEECVSTNEILAPMYDRTIHNLRF